MGQFGQWLHSHGVSYGFQGFLHQLVLRDTGRVCHSLAGEQEHWQEVLKSQLETGLKDVDKEKVVIAYEPIWAIGPGKTPPDEAYITKIGTYIKEMTGGMDVVYGGGLKTDNARMLASVPVMDGGLIALTRFQGQIGFYPEEYLEIVRTYLERD